MLEIQVWAWVRHTNVVGVKPINGITTIPLLVIGSPTVIQIHVSTNDKKAVQIHFHSKRPHTITRMNDNINMDSIIAGSMNDHCQMTISLT